MANAINSLNFGGSTYTFTLPYGTCSTAAATAAKTVDVDNFSLETGARVLVKFTVTNTAKSPTLNVESTGAKSIMYRGSAITAGYLAANRVYEFVYDGTDWELIGDINTDSGGDIKGVTAGAGLTGGGTSGTVTLNVGEGSGITVAADSVSVKAGAAITVDSNGVNNAGVRSITQDSTDGHKLTINTGGTTSTITIPDNNTDTNYYHTPSSTSGIKIATGTGVSDMYVPTGTTSTTVAVGNHTHSSYANQNAFSNIKVGSTTIAADTTTDTLTLVAGDNITLTPDATNDKITISATGGGSTDAMPKSGGAFTGTVTASSTTSYSGQIRNIHICQSGDNFPAGNEGDILLVFSFAV